MTTLRVGGCWLAVVQYDSVSYVGRSTDRAEAVFEARMKVLDDMMEARRTQVQEEYDEADSAAESQRDDEKGDAREEYDRTCEVAQQELDERCDRADVVYESEMEDAAERRSAALAELDAKERGLREELEKLVVIARDRDGNPIKAGSVVQFVDSERLDNLGTVYSLRPAQGAEEALLNVVRKDGRLGGGEKVNGKAAWLVRPAQCEVQPTAEPIPF
jgi:hypothetical protein